MVNISLILFGVSLNALAQLLLKKGMTIIGKVTLDLSTLASLIPKLIANGYILGGIFCYIVSVLVWLIVLSREQVSYAYPFLSIGYIITAVAAYVYLGEGLSPYKIVGIIVICLGIVIMSIQAGK